MIQELNYKNTSPSDKQLIHNFCPQNISGKPSKFNTESQEAKMEIELLDSNQLNGSISTQASNNIKSSLDSKNLNI